MDGHARFNGELMVTLIPVKASHIDFVWSECKDKLAESCEEECTIDQLKTELFSGHRTLVKLDRDGATVGWGVFKVDQYPNFRCLHVTNLWARKARFEEFFGALQSLAVDQGCVRIRSCAKDLQRRLYQQKLKFEIVYTTLEYRIGG